MAEKAGLAGCMVGINRRARALRQGLHRIVEPPTLAQMETHMKSTRILGMILMLFTLALGSLATSACTSATDSSASSTSGSGGGY
ncbi:MAG: hypothetical protein PPHEMADM_1606 [uncultured Paraburkholderia sp.]|nr:MAG: hypothetical protein PPHEMADE_1742 [uncultured Paraburkholderia sp.]CAH2916443.1 MAG: hypothetical protein PPHEMADM_1606 [uncultured Paraburkholderia sp.]